MPARTHARPLTPLAALCAGWLLLAPGLAQAGEDDLSLTLQPRALAGTGWPRLVVQAVPGPRIQGLVLELQRSDGERLRQSAGPLGPQRAHTFELRQPQGTFRWEGRLVVRVGKGEEWEKPLSFETTVLPPPRLSVTDDAVDLARRTVTFSADRPLAAVTLRVQSDYGALLADVRHAIPPGPPGPVTVSWEQPPGAVVLRIDLRAEDAHGFYADLELYPWWIEIPHEDVLFATGRSEILPEEAPKLQAALAELRRAIERYGRIVRVSLFVVGHTDTVGDDASNQALSEARARSIAAYFRKAGVQLPLSYAGFGEKRLLVATPDETDEPRNRRAQYIVAVEPPFPARWTRVP